ncbi:biofilm development regulator YmgB/AriR family protein [Brenneria izbisi]|uniref:Biofilm development regulator YmgB/AriR family protein n=1 Tax=Brenneria izbisi TaxID=2939450 RepID=A0AA42C4A2_9GAMM|nr:biofilm development regulator YmgB/AriR family protein [Brenneria izbisi]MCV9877746.1 biofilm development regulator YmgB/AriR family protein [Brenneria izbisi]MCV9880689.1 biofilm development regulator YmgB/AriR family protein [Brenneria izbisi]
MRENTFQTEADRLISDYLNTENQMNDITMLGHIVDEIIQYGDAVTNKAIISKLLHRIDTETDPIILDRYRTLLEQIVHKTQDDFVI